MVDYDTGMAMLTKEAPGARAPWTEDELRILEEGRKAGYSYAQIGKVLGKQAGAVGKMAVERGIS